MPYVLNPFTGSLDYYASAGTTNNFNNTYFAQKNLTSSGLSALTGSVNGSNTTFTLPLSVYVSGTLSVYLNGVLQVPGDAITETTPASGIFDFVTPPLTNDQIYVIYQKDVSNSTAYLQVANNLSDVNSVSTSRTNLGLGTGDNPQFSTIELGNASDTTLSRSGAGQLAVEGVDVLTTSNTKTSTNKTFTAPTITAPVATGVGTSDIWKDNNNAVSVSSNAGTCSSSFKLNTFTNSSAANMTITISTSGAVDGQAMIVRVYDASAVAKTITWVNTENSTILVPATSNGSTTLPLTIGFQYNGSTSKWRCVGNV